MNTFSSELLIGKVVRDKLIHESIVFSYCGLFVAIQYFRRTYDENDGNEKGSNDRNSLNDF